VRVLKNRGLLRQSGLQRQRLAAIRGDEDPVLSGNRTALPVSWPAASG